LTHSLQFSLFLYFFWRPFLIKKYKKNAVFLLLAAPRFELEKILATRSKLILGKKKQIPN
jgi:hypothetical protein